MSALLSFQELHTQLTTLLRTSIRSDKVIKAVFPRGNFTDVCRIVSNMTHFDYMKESEISVCCKADKTIVVMCNMEV